MDTSTAALSNYDDWPSTGSNLYNGAVIRITVGTEIRGWSDPWMEERESPEERQRRRDLERHAAVLNGPGVPPVDLALATARPHMPPRSRAALSPGRAPPPSRPRARDRSPHRAHHRPRVWERSAP